MFDIPNAMRSYTWNTMWEYHGQLALDGATDNTTHQHFFVEVEHLLSVCHVSEAYWWLFELTFHVATNKRAKRKERQKAHNNSFTVSNDNLSLILHNTFNQNTCVAFVISLSQFQRRRWHSLSHFVYVRAWDINIETPANIVTVT